MATETLRPTSDIAYGYWVPNTGNDRYAMVNEASPDDATTYDTFGSLDQTSLLELGLSNTAIVATETINSVTLHVRGKTATGSGQAYFNCGIKTYGTTYNCGAWHYGTSWTLYSKTWTVNPSTGVAWTPAELDALVTYITGHSHQAYGKGDESESPYITQIYVVVDYTPNVAPTVETHSPATGIGVTSAYVEGHVTADGGLTVTDRGICYSTSTNPTTSSSHVHNGSGTGTFNTELSGLDGATTYHARAFAINSKGTSYGAEVDFTTTNPPSFQPRGPSVGVDQRY